MTDSQSLFEQALAASRQKDIASARVLLKQLIQQEPNHLNAWLLAAHITESRSDAIACFKRVLQIDPNHAYAKQKLSQLEGQMLAAPPETGMTVSAGQSIAPRPKASQLPAERPPEQVQPSKPPARSRFSLGIGIIAVAGILVVVLCLAIVAIGAYSRNGFAFGGTPEPTPSDSKLFNVLYKNAQAAGAENLDAYMATVHPNSFAYGQTEAALKLLFSQYDLTFTFYNLKVISVNQNEAKLHFSLVTRKRSGPAFRDNIITGTMILRPDKGVWKIYSQEVETTEYEN